MAQLLTTVAQYAMDDYYQNFKGGTDFFTLQDFVFHCGSALGEFYLQNFESQRAEYRQEKKDEVISFSHDWLLEDILPVETKNGETYAIIKRPLMSFPYDKQDSGLQEVLPVKPFSVQLERSNLTELWQYQHLPATNRIFWRLDIDKIKFFKKGECSIKEIRILFVPGIINSMEVPESLVKYAIENAIASIRTPGNGVIVKKSLDGNQNKIAETEVDKAQLK